MRRFGGKKRLDELQREAEKLNLEASGGRVRSNWIEPETLFWEAWRVLPGGEKAAIAREVIGSFVARVEAAAGMDPRRTSRKEDPMEWHRHRILPILWDFLDRPEAGLKPGDPVRRELEAWKADRNKYLSMRPVYSLLPIEPPWK